MRPAGLVRPGWERVVICASGPSFDDAQALQVVAARAAGSCRVIAINCEWQRVPNADVLYACDGPWWNEFHEQVAAGFAGERWTQAEPQARAYNLKLIHHVRRRGLTKSPRTIHGGGNGGYQAINLAYLFGAQHLALVGLDMQLGANGEARTHDNYTKANRLLRPSPYAAWLRAFDDLARDLAAEGVRVDNCSPRSALACFPRADLAATLRQWANMVPA